MRCDNRNMKCAFRLAQEGLPTINGFIGPVRRLRLSHDDLVMLLQNNDPTKPPLLSTLSEEVRNAATVLAPGSCVLEYENEEKGFELTLVGWRGTTSLRAYVDQDDTVHMLRLLGADISKYGKKEGEKEGNLMWLIGFIYLISDKNKYLKGTEDKETAEEEKDEEDVQVDDDEENEVAAEADADLEV